MDEAEADNLSHRVDVAVAIKRSCGDNFAFESVDVIQVKDLFSSRLSSESSSPG